MSRFRGLNFERFMATIPPDLVARFFERIPEDHRPDAWAALNPDQLTEYLREPKNAEHGALIGETFQRISDLATSAVPALYRACERYAIPVDGANDEPPTALAFRVFLDHPEAFDFAWARYLLYGTGTKVNTYPFPADARPLDTADAVDGFRCALAAWLAERAKGVQCRVQCFPIGATTSCSSSVGITSRP